MSRIVKTLLLANSCQTFTVRSMCRFPIPTVFNTASWWHNRENLPHSMSGLNLPPVKFYSTSGGGAGIKSNSGIQKHLAALRFKSRTIKRKTSGPGKDEWSVVGYSVAEAFDIFSLKEGLRDQSLYSCITLSDDLEGSCIYARSNYVVDLEEEAKEIFFFKEGSVIFWNVPELERNSVLKFLKEHSEEPYEEDVVYDESEMMSYCVSKTENSYLGGGLIHMNLESEVAPLAKYTFSNAIATSVKLGTWEATLEQLIDSIEHISEDLKRSANVKLTENEVLQKTGEILALRHLINLASDLLDTPDFYWDREQLEGLYLATCSHLSVAKRTKIVNEKLSHCLEVMELISSHLNNRHAARLEWIIIVLIAIEIGFEMLHLIERKFGGFAILDPKPSAE